MRKSLGKSNINQELLKLNKTKHIKYIAFNKGIMADAPVSFRMKNKGFLLLFTLCIFLFLFCCKNNNVVLREANLNQILAEFHNPDSDRASNKKYPENSLAEIQYSHRFLKKEKLR